MMVFITLHNRGHEVIVNAKQISEIIALPSKRSCITFVGGDNSQIVDESLGEIVELLKAIDKNVWRESE